MMCSGTADNKSNLSPGIETIIVEYLKSFRIYRDLRSSSGAQKNFCAFCLSRDKTHDLFNDTHIPQPANKPIIALLYQRKAVCFPYCIP